MPLQSPSHKLFIRGGLVSQSEFNQRESRRSHVGLQDEINYWVYRGIKKQKSLGPAIGLAPSTDCSIGQDHRCENHKWHANTDSQGTQHVTQRGQDFFLPSEGGQRNIVGIFCGDLSAVATNCFVYGHLHRSGKQDEETAAYNPDIVGERGRNQTQNNGKSDPREPCDGDCS